MTADGTAATPKSTWLVPAEQGGGDRPPEAASRSRLTSPTVALRVVSHLVAEVPLAVVAGLQLAHGWLPTSDDAVIAWRSWSVFSGPVPLVGQYTQISAASRHAVFDPGPLQYFLLALPTRIDPLHGLLWGSAILVIALAALAIEAAVSTGGVLGGALAGLGLAVAAETLVQSTANLAWNPSLGLYAFVATFLSAFAVSRGRFAWLPVSVATASLAAQCHTSFALPALAVLAVALLAGGLERRRIPFRPLAVSVVVGLATVVAPLVQEVTGHPGNLSLLASGVGHLHHGVGITQALRGLGTATELPPSWWPRAPAVSTAAAYKHFAHGLYRAPAASGATALGLSGVVAVVGWLSGRRALSCLAALATMAGLGACVTLGSVPAAQKSYLAYYLYFVLWPIGMAMLTAFAWALGSLARAQWRTLAPRRHREPARRRPGGGRLLAFGAAAALLGAGAGLVALEVPLGSSSIFLLGWVPIHDAKLALPRALELLRAHEPAGHPEPFAVEASKGFVVYQSAVADTVGYLLATKGYPAKVTGVADWPLGKAYRPPAGAPILLVSPTWHNGVQVTWTAGGRLGGSGGRP